MPATGAGHQGHVGAGLVPARGPRAAAPGVRRPLNLAANRCRRGRAGARPLPPGRRTRPPHRPATGGNDSWGRGSYPPAAWGAGYYSATAPVPAPALPGGPAQREPGARNTASATAATPAPRTTAHARHPDPAPPEIVSIDSNPHTLFTTGGAPTESSLAVRPSHPSGATVPLPPSLSGKGGRGG